MRTYNSLEEFDSILKFILKELKGLFSVGSKDRCLKDTSNEGRSGKRGRDVLILIVS